MGRNRSKWDKGKHKGEGKRGASISVSATSSFRFASDVQGCSQACLTPDPPRISSGVFEGSVCNFIHVLIFFLMPLDEQVVM